VKDLDAIDFGGLYRAHMARQRHREKTHADWDGRAQAMSRDIFSGAYVEGFVARLDLADCATLLDVGCGPGTIGLTVAPRLAHVYGMDYSAGMLEAFVGNARARGIANATPILRAWEQDWSDVPVCDVLVASRSTHVADLEAALVKLDAHARRRVYVTQLAGGRFLEPGICEALGRPDDARPDYIYTVNILRQHGIHPTLDYIEGDNRLRSCVDFEDFLRRVVWSLGELTPDEQKQLRAYYERHRDRIGQTPMRWALVSWEKGPRDPNLP
jgi:SAM-dependent methyltransferase